jgi:CRISPR-associated protein Cas5d
MQRKLCRLVIGGDYACFSRPEFKTERVSYPVMTPSAARGAIEAIFWKPEISWEVRRIHVLHPIREASIMRNELSPKQSLANYPILVEEGRQQRTSRLLKDVAYLVEADVVLEPHATEPLAKYLDQFERRVVRGQFHHVPYLGCREFAAWFEPDDKTRTAIPVDVDLGPMLFDQAFIPDGGRHEMSFHRHGPGGANRTKGFTRSMFFEAKLKAGVLEVPMELYQKKRQLEGKAC